MRLFGRSNGSSASGGAAHSKDCDSFAKCENKAQFVAGATATVVGLGIAALSLAEAPVPVVTAAVMVFGATALPIVGGILACAGVYAAYKAYNSPSNSLDNKVAHSNGNRVSMAPPKPA